MSEEYNVENKSGASWHLPAIIVLGLIAVGGLAFGWNASSKLDATQQQVATQVSTLKQGIEQDMSSLKDRLVQDEKTNTDFRRPKVVTDKLKSLRVN
jgi:hypothetical protein